MISNQHLRQRADSETVPGQSLPSLSLMILSLVVKMTNILPIIREVIFYKGNDQSYAQTEFPKAFQIGSKVFDFNRYIPRIIFLAQRVKKM